MTRDGVPPPPPPAAGCVGEGPRRCSQCGHHGHNARTCTARPVKLFGVRIGDKLIRKSASMGNLAQLAEGSGGGRDEGYGSEGEDKQPRKRGEAWSEEEHKKFLLGLNKLGKGDWRGISRNYVMSRTPTQVASHAQKYFIRQTNVQRRKRRSSLFDMVIDDSDDQPLSRSSSQEVEEHLEDLQPVTASVAPPAPVPMLTSDVLVPPAAPIVAPPVPLPILTSASAQPPVPAMTHQPKEKESVVSSSNTEEAGIAMPEAIPTYGYSMMLPPPYYGPAFVPLHFYGYPPFFYGPSGAVQASHELFHGPPAAVQALHDLFRPVAVHSKPPVNVEDLYTMSELSLKGNSNTNGVVPKLPLPPKPTGRPERQSAFHGKGPSNGAPNGLIPAK